MFSAMGCRIIVAIVVCYACVALQAEAAHLKPRDTSSNIQLYDKGNSSSFILDYMDYIAHMLSQAPLINSFIGTILAGCLPCEVSLEHGIQCQGIEDNGGIAKIFIRAVNNVPDERLPEIFKAIITLMIKIFEDRMSENLLYGFPGISQIVK